MAITCYFNAVHYISYEYSIKKKIIEVIVNYNIDNNNLDIKY